MLIEKTAWPSNKTCAAMISVNLDAEFFGKIYYPDVNVDEGDILRLGRTGIRFGLPKLLEVLDRFGVKATFFIPGAVVKRYPEMCIRDSQKPAWRSQTLYRHCP